MSKNLYQVLQVDPEAEPDVIEVVYRKLARKYHPDVSLMPDAAERMKELNAAYAVLRDPGRRAGYDRELAAAAQTATQATAPNQGTQWSNRGWEVHYHSEPEPRYRQQYRAEPPPQTEWARCERHPTEVAATRCADCGAPLCAYCSRLFQPPTCTSCLLRWAGRRRMRLLGPALAFPAALIVAYLVWAAVLRGLLGLQVSGWVLLALTYWTGSFYYGLRGARELAPDSDGIVIGFIAIVLGPFAAPVLIARSLGEYRQVQRLEAIARTA